MLLELGRPEAAREAYEATLGRCPNRHRSLSALAELEQG
jgi:hypothetical protein